MPTPAARKWLNGAECPDGKCPAGSVNVTAAPTNSRGERMSRRSPRPRLRMAIS